MKKLTRIHNCIFPALLLLFLISGIIGCAAQKTVLYKSPGVGLDNYSAIEIPDFGNDTDWVPPDSTREIPERVSKMLKEKGIFSEVTRPSAKGSAPKDGVLILSGTIVGYDSGCVNRKRLSLGIGDVGESSLTARVRLVDKATDKIIADAIMEGRTDSKTGDRYRRLVDEIVRFIEKNSKK